MSHMSEVEITSQSNPAASNAYKAIKYQPYKSDIEQMCREGRSAEDIGRYLGLSNNTYANCGISTIVSRIVKALELSDIWKYGRRRHGTKRKSPVMTGTRVDTVVAKSEKYNKHHNTQHHHLREDGFHGAYVDFDYLVKFFKSVGKVLVQCNDSGYMLDNIYLPNKGYIIAHANLIRSKTGLPLVVFTSE